ncbi:hypothetical protein DFJ74DRAFT_664307 [Hyaloraphidium curvatum]|nr:hypothetical protein DFJ74DRAFT_664307 [Hyaloraphidium curvatum]
MRTSRDMCQLFLPLFLRTVDLRTGVVFRPKGGGHARQERLLRKFLGGPNGAAKFSHARKLYLSGKFEAEVDMPRPCSHLEELHCGAVADLGRLHALIAAAAKTLRYLSCAPPSPSSRARGRPHAGRFGAPRTPPRGSQ